jgi:preprotein translocase subunit SecF
VSSVAEPAAPAPPAAPEEEPQELRLRAPRRLDFVGRRNWYFALSLVVILPGLVSMVTQGFLLGIDFAGGTEFFLKFDRSPSLAQVQAAVATTGVAATVQTGGAGSYIIRTGFADPQHQRSFEDELQARLGPVDQAASQVNTIGATIAGETVRNAFIAVISAAVLILLYLAFRFRRVQGGWRSGFQFGGSALLALLHDVAVLTGIFSILGKGVGWLGFPGSRLGDIDALFMTAVLTVVGFSVHDTIVVFDRIRENMIVARSLTFEQIVNLSIMQTAARSVITSFTVVLVLVSLLIAGGESLKGFVLALLIGIVSGTYSSIFNASPLLVVWRRLAGVTR